jgi:streptogramin lyase
MLPAMNRIAPTLLIALLGVLGPASAEARPGDVSQFPLPAASAPEGIAVGPDGALWFTEGGSNKIGRLTTGGELREFPVPTLGLGPSEIAAGPDGNLWFTENTSAEGSRSKIGRITPDGQVSEFPLPEWDCGSYCRPWGIAAGPDGNLWFTAAGMFGAVGRISPAGEITLFRLGGEGRGIAVGPDGNLWVAVVVYEREEQAYGQIARVTTGGSVTRFRLPGEMRASDITAGPDGDLWFVGDGIGHIDTTGRITIIDAYTAGELNGIVAGPDGNIWFSSGGVLPGGIGRVTPLGMTSAFVPRYNARGVTVGPDGAIWFTGWAQSTIGRLTPGLAGLEISSSRATVRKGHTRLEIACSGASGRNGRCGGVVKLVMCVGGETPEGACRRATVVLGWERYDLASGSSGLVRLRLTRRAGKLLDRPGEFWVKAAARPSLGQGMTRPILLRRGSRR